LNDGDEDLRGLCRWVVENMGADTPLHFSRFFPNYRMKNLPPTPAETLGRARDIAKAEGLDFVYLGNIIDAEGENTYCASCGELLVERVRYSVLQNRLEKGRCPSCGAAVPGVWL